MADKLKVSYRRVEDLIPYARNARTHSDDQVARIAGSIKEFGWTNPTVVVVPFNPTAENLAQHLATIVAPIVLKDTGVTVTRCIVEETRKCSAEWRLFSALYK